MDGRRTALIVASDEFEHPGLSRLRAPSADARALADVLGDPEVGGFEVRVVHNAPSHTVQGHIEDLFAEGKAEDLLLLHFSGHGLKSDSGELFFAAPNTRPDRLASTAVPADFVQRCMRGSRARSIVLFLDCCYGGAFGQGVAVRAAGPANVLDSFPAGRLGGGRGRAVITASSAMEYAFEGADLASDQQQQPSVFSSAVVEGLATGAADRDEDGLISLNELYDYVFDKVREQNPSQTPSRDIELQGELYVARSRRKRLRAAPLPPDVEAALQDHNMYTRAGAVGELENRLRSADLGVALGAHQALENIARSDISYVAAAAGAALAAATATATPTELRIGAGPDASPGTELRIRLHGPPLATAVAAVRADPWLTVSPSADGAVVTVNAFSTEERTGTITLTTAAGQVVAVRVVGEAQPVGAEAHPAAQEAELAVPDAEPTGPDTGATAPRATLVTAAVAGPTPVSASPGPTPSEVAREVTPASASPKRTPSPAGQTRLSVLGGRTALTAGALMLTGFVAPEFIYADELFTQRRTDAIALGILGVFAVAVGAAVLWLPRVRRLASWAALLVGAAALLQVLGLLGLWSELDWADIYFGYWVALAGSLAMAVAATLTAGGLREATTADTSRVARPALTPLAALSGWMALTGGGLMLLGTFAVRFIQGVQAFVDPTIVWAPFFSGLLGLAAGATTLWLRHSPLAGPALTGAAGATAVWGLWGLPRIWSGEGVGSLNSGFWIELVAHPALVGAGIVALVALSRAGSLKLAPSVLAKPAAWVVVGLGIVGAIPFLRVAYASWGYGESGDAVHDLQMAAFTVAIPVLAAALRPSLVGRLVMLGWALGAVGTVIAYWRLLQSADASLVGVPYVLLTLSGLAVVALVGRLWTPTD